MFSRPTGFPFWFPAAATAAHDKHHTFPGVKIMRRSIKCHRNRQTWVGDRARNELVRL